MAAGQTFAANNSVNFAAGAAAIITLPNFILTGFHITLTDYASGAGGLEAQFTLTSNAGAQTIHKMILNLPAATSLSPSICEIARFTDLCVVCATDLTINVALLAGAFGARLNGCYANAYYEKP